MPKHLLQLRTKLQLPQAVMAEILGIDLGNYSNIEAGLRELPLHLKKDYLALLETVELDSFKMAANNSETENKRLEKLTNQLTKELVKLEYYEQRAQKRLAQLLATYSTMSQCVVSLEAIMASNTSTYNENFLKQINLSHGRLRLKLSEVVLPNIYKTKEKLYVNRYKIELIKNTIISPKGLYNT